MLIATTHGREKNRDDDCGMGDAGAWIQGGENHGSESNAACHQSHAHNKTFNYKDLNRTKGSDSDLLLQHELDIAGTSRDRR
jgi:hypothetical protein